LGSHDLTLPEGRVVAGLVPLHPAEDSSPDHPLLRHLAEALPALGIAVLRYDRRGFDVPLRVQADDALRAIADLRRSVRDPSLPVGVWGFSQGVWAATLAAEADAAFLVSVSGSGVSPADQMRYGTREQLRRNDFGEHEQDELLRLRAAFESYLRGDAARAEVEPLVRAAARKPWFDLAWVPAELPEPGWWPDMDFDPAEAIARLSCPILAFFSDDDEWVPVEPSIERWRAAAARGGAPLTVVRLRGTSHEPPPEAYEQMLMDWLRDEFLPSAWS
jgi:uncharacterized protein